MSVYEDVEYSDYYQYVYTFIHINHEATARRYELRLI